MTVRPLPEPNGETTTEPVDRASDSGNVIQIVCPGCAQAIVLDPRRVQRSEECFVLPCPACQEVVKVRCEDATRPVPGDIAMLYTVEPTDARPAWKRLLKRST